MVHNLAVAYNNLGIVLKHQGNYRQAIAMHQQTLTFRRAQGDLMRLASTLRELGDLMTLTGQLDEAQRFFAESLTIRRNLDDRRGVWLVLSGVGRLMLARRCWSDCARLCGAILDAGQQIGFTMPPEERRVLEDDIRQLRQQLGEAEFATAWTAGQQLGLDQAAGEVQIWLDSPFAQDQTA